MNEETEAEGGWPTYPGSHRESKTARTELHNSALCWPHASAATEQSCLLLDQVDIKWEPERV